MTAWNNILKPGKGDIRAISPVTGTTTVNTYVEVVDLDTRWMGDTNIIISVTVNSLDYRILVYNDYALGVGHETTTSTITAADSDQVVLARHARVKVEIKPTASGVHGSYQIDCIAGR